MSNHDFKSFKGSVDDLNRLPNFDGAIEGYDLFRTHSIGAQSQYFQARLPADRQNGRSLEFRENFQRRDAASNRQILRTDSRETSPLRTKPVLFGSSFGNAIEARNTRRQTDASAQSRPNARALVASLDKTILAQEPARARRMTGSHSELRNWRFQVPKNRKVFRRILGSSASGDVNPRARVR